MEGVNKLRAGSLNFSIVLPTWINTKAIKKAITKKFHKTFLPFIQEYAKNITHYIGNDLNSLKVELQLMADRYCISKRKDLLNRLIEKIETEPNFIKENPEIITKMLHDLNKTLGTHCENLETSTNRALEVANKIHSFVTRQSYLTIDNGGFGTIIAE